MNFVSILSFSCVILSVSCAPQRYWASDESDEVAVRPYWLTPRRSSVPQYGSFSDEMTRMLDELQKSILSVQAVPQFPTRGRFPVLAVSTSTDDDDSDGGTSISIGGTGFGSLFNTFGGFDTKDLKNKTTVKTEVIDGHKVTVKESTYVTDNDGFKSVIHLSEVDLADSEETDSGKPKESTPKSTEEEGDTDDKETEDKPKEESSTPDNVEDKTENQTPETPEVETNKSEEPAPKKVENEDTSDNENSEENSVRSNRHPDEDVEEIETNGKDFYNYYNTVDRIQSKEVGKNISA